MPRATRWTDAELVAAVAGATTFKQVCDALGLRPGGGTYRSIERHIERLGLDASHLARRERPRRRRPWTDDELAEVVQHARSWSAVARNLGYEANGGIHRFLKAHVVRLGLDTSHFQSQGWAKGMTFPGRRTTELAELLVERSTASSSVVRRRLIAEGLRPARCERCALVAWHGTPVPLELDHINGDHTDNRLENLRILCPNCHAQTETYGRRKRSG